APPGKVAVRHQTGQVRPAIEKIVDVVMPSVPLTRTACTVPSVRIRPCTGTGRFEYIENSNGTVGRVPGGSCPRFLNDVVMPPPVSAWKFPSIPAHPWRARAV